MAPDAAAHQIRMGSDTALIIEIRAWVNVYERELITRDEMVLEIGKVLAHD